MPSKTRTTIAAVPNIAEPEPPVFLDVDKMEREGVPKGPYPILLSNQRFVLKDAQEMDWQDLVRAQMDPVGFFRKAMNPTDVVLFLALPMEFWRFHGLIGKYLAHYGIGTQGEA
jgi:hypothetical protein